LIDIIINSIVYGLLVSFIGYLGFRNIFLRRKAQEAITEKLQLLIRINILETEFSKTIQEIENMKLEKSDDFVKFLSDSRDWAYEYIETVQSGLTKFVSDVDADISYFDEYGETLSMGRPDFAAMKNISIAYKDLKKMLPESDSDGR